MIDSCADTELVHSINIKWPQYVAAGQRSDFISGLIIGEARMDRDMAVEIFKNKYGVLPTWVFCLGRDLGENSVSS